MASCSCHIHYELWVRTSYDMHQILRPDFPQLMSTQDPRDPRFRELRELILKNSNDCPKEGLLGGEDFDGSSRRNSDDPTSTISENSSRSTEGVGYQVMYTESEKLKWIEPAFTSDCGPGHVAVLMNCAFKSVLWQPDDEETTSTSLYERYVSRDAREFVRFMQLANYQIPVIQSCLDRSVWGFDVEEWFDNYRLIMMETADLTADLERRTGAKNVGSGANNRGRGQ
eukprot:g7650.t1